MEETIQGLVDLGFSRLEAEVYTALCRQSPMTGYRVAQELNKAATPRAARPARPPARGGPRGGPAPGTRSG